MEHQKLKIVFFSSAAIGIPFLEELCNDDRFEVMWIVTQPDQPSGRGMEIKPNIIKTKSQELNIKNITTPNTLRLGSKKYPWEWEEFQQWLVNLQPDYIVVIAYWKIIPQHILDIPSIAPINIHWSLLPKYRWASPIQTCLLNGDSESWITIMKMSAWLDEWDIIKQLHISLEISTTTKDLINTFWIIWPGFTNQVLVDFSNNKEKAIPQDNSLATFTTKIIKEDGLIDIYNMPIEQIIRMHNAYYLRPKIYFIYNDKRIIVEDLIINSEKYVANKSASLVDSSNNLHSAIQQILLKPEGKRSMTRNEFSSWAT